MFKDTSPSFRRIDVDENGCWNWLGYVGRNGYPRVSIARGLSRPVHRIIAEILNGLPTCVVHHRCENRHCVNPSHWEILDDHSTHATLHNDKRGCRFHGNLSYYRKEGQRSGYCRICREEKRVLRGRERKALATAGT